MAIRSSSDVHRVTKTRVLRPYVGPKGAEVNYQPSLEQVLETARRGDNNLIPIFRDVPADLETPVSAFLKVARGEHSFLLESVGGRRAAGPLQLHRDGAVPRLQERPLRRPDRRRRPADRDRAGDVALQPLAPEGQRGAHQPAALHRRRGRLPGLRRGPPLRAARHDPGGGRDRLPGSAVHVRRLAARLRSRQARRQGRRALPAGRRRRGLVPAGLLEDRRAGQAPEPRAAGQPLPDRALPRARRAGVERRARPLHRDGAAREGVHRRRRHHPGRAVAAAVAQDGGAPVLDLPRAADGQPVAVHVLPADGRLLHRRRVAGDARAGGGRRRRDAPDRRHDAARPATRTKTPRSSDTSWPTRRSARST